MASRQDQSTRRAIVRPDGELEELDGRASVEFIRRHPIFRDACRAFLASGVELVHFTWIGPRREWLAACIELTPGGRAALSVTRTQPPFGLTPRELDVLTLVAGGLSDADIANRLGTSPRTVTTHLSRILVKLDQSNRAGAASVAVDLGLVRLPVPGGGRSLAGLSVGRIDDVMARGRAPREQPPLHRRELPPVRLGAVLPVNPLMRADGIEMRNGAELAVEEINARGGIGGRSLELLSVEADIISDAGVERAFTALAEAEVEAIVSGYTGAQHVANEIAAEYGCVYLNAATLESTIEILREDPSRYGRIFHVCPSDAHYGPGFVRFLDGLRASGRWTPPNRRLAVIVVRWPAMNIGLEALVDRAEAAGWSVDLIAGIELEPGDWGPILERIESVDPSAVLLAHYWPNALVSFQRAFLARPIDTLVYTLYGPSVPEYRQALGSAAEGVLWATVTGVYPDGVGRGFAARYAARHGMPPGRSHAGIAYDRVRIVANAWARVSNPRAFHEVAADIRSSVHRGVNGAYFFDHGGQSGLAYPDVTADPSIAQAHLVFQIQDGAHRTLFPSPYDDGRFRMPPWFERA